MPAQIIPLPTRRPPPGRDLTDQDCFAIAACLPGAWLAERAEDHQGHVMMALFRDEEDADPAFIARRDQTGLRLETGSAARVLQRCEDPASLADALRRLLGTAPVA